MTMHSAEVVRFPMRIPSADGRVRRPCQNAAGGGRDERGSRSGGQSLVEFSLVLTPLLLVLLGIVQFGFIFNSHVTLTNAAREGARAGTIYEYDRNRSKGQNDALRDEAVRTAFLASLNLLSTTSPQMTTTSTWTSSEGGLTWTNGDLTITYRVPTGIPDSDARRGQEVTLIATYRQDLIVPLIAALLPRDAGGRLPLTSRATMVIN